MLPQADKLIERARKGERLTSTERRHCVAYLSASNPELTNIALGELFKVGEKTIRDDRKHMREEKAKRIKEDDTHLIVADIMLNFEKQFRDIESSKQKTRRGSSIFLDHCKAAMSIQLQAVKALQDLGFYPKNLGNLTETKYVFEAHVGEDMSVHTRKVNLEFEDVKVIDARKSAPITDAEFVDMKQITAPDGTNSSTQSAVPAGQPDQGGDEAGPVNPS